MFCCARQGMGVIEMFSTCFRVGSLGSGVDGDMGGDSDIDGKDILSLIF